MQQTASPLINTYRAARLFEQKVAKLLKNPKYLHQRKFKISKDIHKRPPKSQKYLHQIYKNHVKNTLETFFGQFLKTSPRSRQILKSPK